MTQNKNIHYLCQNHQKEHQEIKKILGKGVITTESPVQGQFLCSLFMVPKESGDFYPV